MLAWKFPAGFFAARAVAGGVWVVVAAAALPVSGVPSPLDAPAWPGWGPRGGRLPALVWAHVWVGSRRSQHSVDIATLFRLDGGWCIRLGVDGVGARYQVAADQSRGTVDLRRCVCTRIHYLRA